MLVPLAPTSMCVNLASRSVIVTVPGLSSPHAPGRTSRAASIAPAVAIRTGLAFKVMHPPFTSEGLHLAGSSSALPSEALPVPVSIPGALPQRRVWAKTEREDENEQRRQAQPPAAHRRRRGA